MFKHMVAALFSIACFAGVGYAQVTELSMNQASVEELMEIEDGVISRQLAQSIVDYRKAHGAFETVKDLLQVPGFKAELLDILVLQQSKGDIVYESNSYVMMPTY